MNGGQSFIYKFPRNETFISFSEYNQHEDIGFFPGDLRLEMCSHVAFLTHDRLKNEAILNLLFIDPYYEIC